MRRVMWTLACALALCGPAAGVPARAPDLSTTDAVLRWINGYRTKPDIAQVPVAVRTLSQLGALRDSETSAVYVGFVAGIIGYHPQNAGELIEKMLPIKASNKASDIQDWRKDRAAITEKRTVEVGQPDGQATGARSPHRQ